MDSGRTGRLTEWGARPWAARLLRALVFVLPFTASVVFVWVVSRMVTAPDGSAGFVAWWLVLSAGGSLVMFLVDRLARRALPLAALLQLSLVFPDQAPSRFRAALEAGRVARLEDRLELMDRASRAGDASESAELLLTLVAALSAHDRITRGHSERVRGYAVMIGRELGLPEDEIDQLNWAALLHDVGKLEVPTEILNNPGRPSEEEWRQLRRHPLYGERLVEPMRAWLGTWADAVGYHHERWDGKGYPRGIAGDDIPLPGRIVAIADVFDVITSARSYKEPGSPDAGRAEIARCAGTQFDPRLVRAFLNVSLGRMRMVMGPLSWLAHLPILGRLPVASMASTVWGAVGVVVATTATGIAGTHAPVSDAEAAARTPVATVQRPAAAPAAHARRPVVKQGHHHAARRARTAGVEEPTPDRVAPPVSPLAPPAVGADPVAPATPSAPADPEPAPAAPKVPADPQTLPPLTPTPVAATPEPVSPPPPVAAEPAAAPAPDLAPAVVITPVAPVPNHAPSFAAGADETVLEDSGARAVPGWAGAITPGPFESGQIVTFVVTSDDPGLFSAAPAVTSASTLTYTPAADAHGTTTVTVHAVDDGGTAAGGDDTSADQTFTITITSVNDRPSFVAGADQSVLEDAGARAVSGWAGAISPGPANETGQDVTFLVSANDPGLFSAQPAVSPAGTLTYTPAPDAHGTATVLVTAVDDGGSAHGGVDTGAPQSFTITITAVNDAPSFTPGASPVVLEDDPAQTVGGWASAISPGPADESGQAVSFLVTNDASALFSVQPALSPTGTLTYTPAAGAHGVATVTVRAVDDGGTADGGDDTSAPRTFTITITSPNHAPSFTDAGDRTVLEDSGPAAVPAWASAISPGPAQESGQTVAFQTSGPGAGLFSAAPAVAPSGTLTFTPAADANGTATLTVNAQDNGGTADGGHDTSTAHTFTITVTPVNDAPSFAAGAGQGVFINASLQTLPGWASGIAPGPANESGQSVSFSVSNSNPGLFTVQPRVDPDGTLVYQPAVSFGSATVTVRAVDDGGTANGGVDTSAPQTFTIVVFL